MSDTTCGQLYQRPITTASLYVALCAPGFIGQDEGGVGAGVGVGVHPLTGPAAAAGPAQQQHGLPSPVLPLYLPAGVVPALTTNQR